MALGSLIIQTKFQYSDHELVEQITENPYLQYFTGLSGYQKKTTFDASKLVLFWKRLKYEIIMETNGYMLDCQDDDRIPSSSGSGKEEASEDNQKELTNRGTLIVDAICVSVYIHFLQDISFLNDAREKLERIST